MSGKTFNVDVSLNKEVAIKLWKSSGSGLWIQTLDPDQIYL